MAKLVWDGVGDRLYETGVDRCVLYVSGDSGYDNGVAWNGLTGVTESPSGAEASAIYANNGKYLNLYSAEEFGATIKAYTYPPEFEVCDGTASIAKGVKISQQARKSFAFTYRTLIGNDVDGTEKGYKIHLVYGAMATPSEKDYATVNDSPEAIEFSWEVSTTPVEVDSNHKATSVITIDSTEADPAKLKSLEDMLYGTADKEPKMPTPAEVVSMFSGA